MRHGVWIRPRPETAPTEDGHRRTWNDDSGFVSIRAY